MYTYTHATKEIKMRFAPTVTKYCDEVQVSVVNVDMCNTKTCLRTNRRFPKNQQGCPLTLL